ncbi:MAG: hypothetical protein H0T73_04785 [Ardenticatenales bacterium]|nr:hypothetical protein [Ardenticatenales bacterium]
MKRFVLWVNLCLVLLGLVACNTDRQPTEASKEGQNPAVRGTLWSERRHYREGEFVYLRFTLENLSNEEVVLESQDPSKSAVDIYFVDQDLLWSTSTASEQAMSRIVLPPSGTYIIEWTLPPLPRGGQFSFYGLWPSVNGEVRHYICYGITPCP